MPDCVLDKLKRFSIDDILVDINPLTILPWQIAHNDSATNKNGALFNSCNHFGLKLQEKNNKKINE